MPVFCIEIFPFTISALIRYDNRKGGEGYFHIICKPESGGWKNIEKSNPVLAFFRLSFLGLNFEFVVSCIFSTPQTSRFCSKTTKKHDSYSTNDSGVFCA